MICKHFALITIIILMGFITGCGGDEEEPSHLIREESSEPPMGLHGDTYRNQRHVFKVSNLPVDDWTVLWYPKDREQIGVWFKGSYNIDRFTNTGVIYLVMQPAKDELQENRFKAFEKRTPFINMWVEKQSATDIYKLTSPKAFAKRFIDDNEVISEGDVRAKDGGPGYFVTSREHGGRNTITYFMRSTGKVRDLYAFYLWAPDNGYDEVIDVYREIVSSFERNIY